MIDLDNTLIQDNSGCGFLLANEEDLDNVFFTSDTHWLHGNIIRYCDRPFKDEYEMTEFLIEKYLEVIKPGSILIHAGDVGFAPTWLINMILDCLPGQKILVQGNHDFERSNKGKKKFRNLNFDYTLKELKIKYRSMVNLENENFIVSHYPKDVGYLLDEDLINIHGHTHNNPDSPKESVYVNVSVEMTNYRPVSFAEVFNILDNHPHNQIMWSQDDNYE